MQNDVFQNAYQVFRGKLWQNEQLGKEISQPRTDISVGDLGKLYSDYFIPGLEEGNTKTSDA